jgi:ribosomal protein S18 acetylase RimI-like enzyme
MKEITVRDATEDDARRIAEIHVSAWRAAYHGIMDSEFLCNLDVLDREAKWKSVLSAQGRGNYLVGVLNEEVQGFCVFGSPRDETADESKGELMALNVHPECWGVGVGAQLVKAALEEFGHAGINNVYLWVVKGNDRAISLYKRFGFAWSGATKIDTSHSNSPITELLYEHKPD